MFLQVPSNLVLRKLRPSVWLSLLTLLWGITLVIRAPCLIRHTVEILCQTTQGFVRNYGQLLGETCRTIVTTFVTRPLGVRWLLGVFEAGLFPGGNYYLSWYGAVATSTSNSSPLLAGTNVQNSASGQQFSSRRPRYQAHSVVCLLYVKHSFWEVAVNLVFLKAAISNMDGVGGKSGWAWIFILEGLVTVVAGFLSFWIIQDFPDTAKFLTEAERAVVIRRLQSDNQHSATGEKFKAKYVWQSVSDWRTYLASENLFSFLYRTSLIDRLPLTSVCVRRM